MDSHSGAESGVADMTLNLAWTSVEVNLMEDSGITRAPITFVVTNVQVATVHHTTQLQAVMCMPVMYRDCML